MVLVIAFSDYSASWLMTPDEVDQTIEALQRWASPSWSWRIFQ
jgi:hypothetical protein